MLGKYGRSITGLRLIPSSGGAFEVSVDGRQVWSKKRTKTFPEPGFVAKQLAR